MVVFWRCILEQNAQCFISVWVCLRQRKELEICKRLCRLISAVRMCEWVKAIFVVNKNWKMPRKWNPFTTLLQKPSQVLPYEPENISSKQQSRLIVREVNKLHRKKEVWEGIMVNFLVGSLNGKINVGYYFFLPMRPALQYLFWLFGSTSTSRFWLYCLRFQSKLYELL